MKRIIATIILVTVLLVGGVGGYAYAEVAHPPMEGDKLLGIFTHGTVTLTQVGDEIRYTSWFTITNPDCTSSITIDRVSIIRSDGTVIYDSSTDGLPTGWLSYSILPHEIRLLSMGQHIPIEEALAHYTLEVSWHGKGSPLMGWQYTHRTQFMGSGNIEKTQTSTQMVNMKHGKVSLDY
ncbi:hypothetical protein ACFLWX_04370 [Chloroflexota bacterium]